MEVRHESEEEEEHHEYSMNAHQESDQEEDPFDLLMEHPDIFELPPLLGGCALLCVVTHTLSLRLRGCVRELCLSCMYKDTTAHGSAVSR